jgi:Arc/MetJ-type ribon-helix-helix transcriptional regulator
MTPKKGGGPQPSPTSQSNAVRAHVRAVLQKLTAHVKQKSVDGSRSIKANREQQRPGRVAYV